jgi:WD40 repeat protein
MIFPSFFSRFPTLVLPVGGADNTVALFDRSTGQTVHKMKGHTKKVLLLRERDSDSTVERI